MLWFLTCIPEIIGGIAAPNCTLSLATATALVLAMPPASLPYWSAAGLVVQELHLCLCLLLILLSLCMNGMVFLRKPWEGHPMQAMCTCYFIPFFNHLPLLALWGFPDPLSEGNCCVPLLTWVLVPQNRLHMDHLALILHPWVNFSRQCQKEMQHAHLFSISVRPKGWSLSTCSALRGNGMRSQAWFPPLYLTTPHFSLSTYVNIFVHSGLVNLTMSSRVSKSFKHCLQYTFLYIHLD